MFKPTTPKPNAHDNYVVRLERSARLANWTAAVSSAGLLAAVTVCIILATRPPPKPLVINFDPLKAQVIELEPKHLSASSLQLVAENYFTQYVIDRETIDHASEQARFNRVRLLSAKENYFAFENMMSPEKAKEASPLVRFKKAGLTRTPHLSSKPVAVPGATGAYQVEFYVVDARLNGTEVARTHWVATWNYYQTKISSNREEAIMNPLGLQIANYTVRARNTGGN
jgi:type IV secretion system protein VirB8